MFPSLTVLDNLEMGAWIYRRQWGRHRQAVNQVLERYPMLPGVGLAALHTKDGIVGPFSKVRRRRLGV